MDRIHTTSLPYLLTVTSSVPEPQEPQEELVRCCALPQLPVTKAACWPTTRHSHPVITSCLQGGKGREGRKKKGQHPEKGQISSENSRSIPRRERRTQHTQSCPGKSRTAVPAPHPTPASGTSARQPLRSLGWPYTLPCPPPEVLVNSAATRAEMVPKHSAQDMHSPTLSPRAQTKCLPSLLPQEVQAKNRCPHSVTVQKNTHRRAAAILPVK